MPAKSKRARRRAQAKPRKATEAQKAELKAEIKRIRERAKAEIAAAAQRLARETAAYQEQTRRDRERKRAEKERAAKLFERAGLLDPAKPKRAKQRRTKTLMQQFRAFLNPKETVFIPTKSKRARTKARARAKELGITTTPKGFFFPREGSRKVSLKYDRERKEYEVVSERSEVNKKSGRRRTVTRTYPLEPLATADDKLAALKSKAKRVIGDKPRGSDRLAFMVEGPHRGRSKMTYSTPELLVNDLERRYDRSQYAPAHLKGKYKSQFIGFLDIVAIQKTTVSKWSKETIRERFEKKQAIEERKAKKRAKPKKRRKKTKPK